jgi:ferritin
VGLPGFAEFFKNASEEEREHAHLLMDYQNKRGGRVKLLVRPHTTSLSAIGGLLISA